MYLVETKNLLKFIYWNCFQTALNTLFLWKVGTFNFRKWRVKTSKQVGIPRDPIAVSWQSLKHTWMSLCCTCTRFFTKSFIYYFKIPPFYPTSLPGCAHKKLNCATASFFSIWVFLVWTITSSLLRKWLLLCSPVICSPNPLKTCAWLQGSIWKPLKILDMLPAPWHGPSALHAPQVTAISSSVELFLPILFMASCILDLYWILLCVSSPINSYLQGN